MIARGVRREARARRLVVRGPVVCARASSSFDGHQRSTPPSTGSSEATATTTSATCPPSHMIDVACRLLKRRVAEVRAVGARAAVGDQVHAQLAARVLDRLEHLAGRDPEALGHQLEVVDQRLHRGAHDLADVVERVAHAVGADGQLRGPGDLLVLDHHRAGVRARGARGPARRCGSTGASPPCAARRAPRSRRRWRWGRRSRTSRSRSTGRPCARRTAGPRCAAPAP